MRRRRRDKETDRMLIMFLSDGFSKQSSPLETIARVEWWLFQALFQVKVFLSAKRMQLWQTLRLFVYQHHEDCPL